MKSILKHGAISFVFLVGLAGCGADDSPELAGPANGMDVSGPVGGSDMSGSSPDTGEMPEDVGAIGDSSLSEDARTIAPDAAMDAGPTGPALIYLDPNGEDSRDGTTEARAILSLNRAQELVENYPDRDVEIRIALGTYFEQKVVWQTTSPNREIKFTRWPSDAEGRPVFDGCESASGACPGGTWFQLRHSGGEETNLNFYYIRVQNYGTAISLNGSRNAEATSNGSNRIFGCYFIDIGNEFNTSLSPSTAAVRLVNSDDNRIENNHFVNVVNTSSGGLIHAIYVAHMSDRNLIRANRFKRSSGDPVRVRDFSNDNEIRDNRFIQVGTRAGYTDWYCDHDARDDCTKAEPECPSWGNEFRDNLLDGKFDCSPLGTFHYFQDDSTTGCAPPSAAARRLRTSGNTSNEPPCTSE